MSLQWLSLIGTIWLQSINGTNSNFPAYSSELKRLLSMSQLQLNNLASASDAGKLLGWLSGVASVYLPLWLVLLIGSFLGLVGYGLQYLFLTHQIDSLSYWQVFLLTVVAGNSICWINTVCYIVAIRNFPLDRQIAVGLSTSYVGLSAKIYTEIVDVFFSSSSSERAKAYLLLNSVLPLVVCMFTAPMVKEMCSRKSRRMEGGFVILFSITIATGTYAVVTSFSSVSRGLTPLVILIGMGVFVFAPLVVPFAEKAKERLQGKCWIRKVHDFNIEEAYVEEGRKDGDRVDTVDVEEEEEEDREIDAKTMIMRVEFWLYFFVYLFGATLGLVYLNNLGQIAESRGYTNTSSIVSSSSSFGFFGRVVPSLLVYVFSRSRRLASSPATIALLMAPISGSFFLLLNKTDMSLYISTTVISFCTGAITSISVSTTTDLFGTKSFSVNHNIVVANIPIGSFLFGDLAALIYRKHGGTLSSSRCIGSQCYEASFVIWGCLCFLGCFLAVILHARTKNLYVQR